ncbi:MAG: SGNH/GDSL hydrolase family protein [Bacteroidaceae bacterium]|nr:SGNH/GDSL hydrolase family protein [Bacteroidaceae bacterium]
MKNSINQMAVRCKSLAENCNTAFRWESSLNKIFSPGSYLVEIDHYDGNLGLPVDFCGSEHYIVGTLVVTDSGTLGHKQNNRVIGQALTFTSRAEKETKIYIRTFADGEWGAWRSLAHTGIYDKISTNDELLASVQGLVSTTKQMQTSLAEETTRATEAEANLAAGLQTVYAAGDNLFFHSTKEDYSGLGDYKYVVSECYVAVEGGKTVFLSGNAVKIAIYEYDSDYSQIKTQSISGTSYDLSERCAYVKWSVAVYDLKYNRTKIMVNYGEEALPYSAFVNSLTFELSDNIEEVGNVISAINTKVDGGDIVTEQVLNFSKSYQPKQPLLVPIKKGSIIEINGAGTSLNFYEEGSTIANTVDEKNNVAVADFTHVRNLTTIGEFTIKATEKSKVGVLEENMKTLENNIAELSKAKLILTEPVVLSSTSEHCLYLDDAIEGNAVGRKYGLTGTQFASYGSVAYVNKPVTGSKKGVFYAPSAVDNVKEEITVKSVAPAPGEINILDIGSSYIDIGTITERQCYNYTRDGYTVNVIGTMGAEGKKHEARSGGTWDFLVKPLGRAVILDVSGVENLPTTGYPGTTYQDANGVKWTVRGVMIAGGAGKLVLSSFSVDANYGGEGATGSTDYDTAAANMPSAGTLTKTTNDSTGTETPGGDDSIQYTAKELVYYNPFWNPATNELDFAYYINKWGFATPDIITLTFGSNDLGNFAEASQDTVDAVVEKAVSVVNKIHEQLPACKVLLTCSCYGYKGVGENNFREVYRIKNIQKYYKTLINVMGQSTEYADYVRVVPTMCMIDRENGYSVSDKTLHSSYPAVKYARDIVHPSTAGFNQFADAMLGYAYDVL